MINKNYDRPLYSLNLIQPGDPTEDEPRFCIQVPQGLLIVSRPLRVRGKNINHDRCARALALGLDFHGRGAAAFARHGLDDEWAQNLRFWWERLCDFKTRHVVTGSAGSLATGHRGEAMQRARQIWKRLSICADLAGLSGYIVTNPPPRDRQRFLVALARAIPLATEHEGRLTSCGFGKAEQDELSLAAEDLGTLHHEADRRGWEKTQLAAMQFVLRGALVGDLSRLVKTAKVALPDEKARACTMNRLLGITQSPRRPPQPPQAMAQPAVSSVPSAAQSLPG